MAVRISLWWWVRTLCMAFAIWGTVLGTIIALYAHVPVLRDTLGAWGTIAVLMTMGIQNAILGRTSKTEDQPRPATD